MVFQNAVVGLASAFLRVIYAILFGVLLLFRLDRVVLMKGFENFDKGHKSYIGFLYLEHTLNNPILLLFMELLLKGRHQRMLQKDDLRKDNLPANQSEERLGAVVPEVKHECLPRCSHRACNRWKVCYTLLRNPVLQKFTAANLKAAKEKLQKGRKVPVSLESSDFSNVETQEDLVPQEDVMLQEQLASEGQVNLAPEEEEITGKNTVKLEAYDQQEEIQQGTNDNICIVTNL